MPNREHLRDGPLKRKLEHELEDRLLHHKELLKIAAARRQAELSDDAEVSEAFEKFIEEMLRSNPLLEQLLGAGFRIANPSKPHAVEAAERPFKGRRFPTKFHFRALPPGRTLERDAHLNSQIRVAFETDAENDYFRRDEEPGVFSLYEVVKGELQPAKNWRTPHLFEGDATLSISALPLGVKIGDVLVYEAHCTDASRIEPIRNRFSLTVRAERIDRTHPRPQPTPHEGPTDRSGTDKHDSSRLNVPTPREITEPIWAIQDPPFDRNTAMRVKRQPGATEEAQLFDYLINMDNVFLRQAMKVEPKRARQFRDRFKFGMTVVALALIHHAADKTYRDRKAQVAVHEQDESGQQDIHEQVAAVTSALAPFLLPLVDSLSKIVRSEESLSNSAGEAA